MAARTRVGTAVLMATALLVPTAAPAHNVLAGDDLFRTDPGSYQDFSGAPIPAGFFDPGSDPFTGLVHLRGNPPGSNPACPVDDLSQVDTIVRRLNNATLPVIPSSATVPIQIVALNLVSVNPITVTYGGVNPQTWNVAVTLSQSAPQPIGSMTITHSSSPGGTCISDNAVRVLDLGDVGGVTQFQASNIPWLPVVPPSGSCASNFCVNPNQLTTEQAPLAAHRVISICPQVPTSSRPPTWGSVKVIYR